MYATEMDPKLAHNLVFSLKMKRSIKKKKKRNHEMCIFINGRLYHSDRHDMPSLNPVPKKHHVTTTDKNQPSTLKAPTSLNAGG